MKHSIRKTGCLMSLAVCLSVLAGCSAGGEKSKQLAGNTAGGKKSKQLERSTALELLRARSEEILFYDVWRVANVLAVPVPDRPIWEFGSAYIAYHQGLLEFSNQLTAVGVLRRLANKDTSVTRHSNVGGIEWVENTYFFEGINQPDVDFLDNSVEFRVNRGSFSRVTGIRQYGNRAEVDVEMSALPTEMYKRLSTAMARTREKLGNPQFQLKPPLPELATLTRTRSAPHTFELYDDGWRVITSSGQRGYWF